MLTGRHILVLDDETLLRKGLCSYLESNGAQCYPAQSIAEATRLLETMELDFALLDINLPDGNGLDLLENPALSRNTRVVMMTAEGGVRTAIEAIRRGASDYLSKPFEPEELPLVLSRIAREGARSRKAEFERDLRPQVVRSLFLGERLKVVEAQLNKILEADARLADRLPPVLVEGETGTGKSTLARWLHENGPRRDKPLVEINCSTLPDSLAESELFGHERGAFTDARKERIGLFEAADGGSLFLDEVASLSPAIQAKVLTAIEDGLIRRIGGNKQRPVNVRLITASLRPLDEMVREGLFREDLYHRLNLLHVRIPSLREYPEDIPALAAYLLEGLSKRYQIADLSLSKAGEQRLMAYAWPGNVRELLHELERSLIFSESGKLNFDNLSGMSPQAPSTKSESLLNPHWELPESGFQLEEALKKLTAEVISRILDEENGNVSAAARRLGVARDFIRYRLP